MPGQDGTGPYGRGQMTGRGFGRCRVFPKTQAAVQPAAEGESNEITPEIRTVPAQGALVPVYGAGRGGIPRGCGRGRAFGGGRYARG